MPGIYQYQFIVGNPPYITYKEMKKKLDDTNTYLGDIEVNSKYKLKKFLHQRLFVVEA